MTKSILLIGLGRFGRHVAMKLDELHHEIMAVDKEERRVEAALPYVTNAQIGDATNEAFLSSLGVSNFDVCIVAIGDNFQSSLEATSLLRELGAKMVVSRAARDVHAKFLLRNGADEVVYPEKQLAAWTAIRYSADHILDYIELDDEHAIFEVTIPEEWVGKTVGLRSAVLNGVTRGISMYPMAISFNLIIIKSSFLCNNKVKRLHGYPHSLPFFFYRAFR